jgi:hypothetical protein
MEEHRWTEDELAEELAKLSEEELFALLNKYGIDIGKWSPPYVWEEKMHFVYKIIEAVPYKLLLKELKLEGE